MRTLPEFPETTIEISDGLISIIQRANYSTQVLKVPVIHWDLLDVCVREELAKPPVLVVEAPKESEL
ncbi:MAG: hypothetical protein JZU60_02830 [Ilumatobacteraceae bacterium]|nr:hypothetical protein [Ilumatobacteraceae bacterium]